MFKPAATFRPVPTRRAARPVLALIVALFAALPFAAAAAAQEALASLQAEYRALYENVKASVVAVSGKPLAEIDPGNPVSADPESASAEAGFVLRVTDVMGARHGCYVVTSYETAEVEARKAGFQGTPEQMLRSLGSMYVITASGASYKCDIVGHDTASLICVLELPESVQLPGLKITTAHRIGMPAAALGNSFDSMIVDGQVSFSVGTVADRYRLEPFDHQRADGEEGDPYRGDCYEFEGAGNQGDHGGPLVNMKGEVIGMMFAHYHGGRRLPVAVPSDLFYPAYDAILGKYKVSPPFVGFSAKNSNAEMTGDPAITKVTPFSPAEAAGLKVGDIIVMIDGFTVSTREELNTALGMPESFGRTTGRNVTPRRAAARFYGMPAGTSFQMTVRREDKYLTVKLTAESKASFDRRAQERADTAANGGKPPAGPGPESGAHEIDRPFSSAADAQALTEIKRAEAHRQSIVQVVLDWDRSHEQTYRQQIAFHQRGLDFSFDPNFLDMKVGPYTGVIVGEAGEILISDNILGGWDEEEENGVPSTLNAIYVTLADGRTFEAKVAGRSQESNLALVKIAATGLKPVTWNDDDLKNGGGLTVVTASNGVTTGEIRSGIVSATKRDNDARFQFDAHVGSCDLGGLVVNAAGGATGIVTGLDVQLVGKASGVAMAAYHKTAIAKSLPDLKAGKFLKRPDRPFLGVAAAPIYADKPGLKVSNVTPDTGAAKAGLKNGDIMLKADGTELRKTEDLVKVILGKKVGEILKLTVRRGGEEIELSAVLGKRPD